MLIIKEPIKLNCKEMIQGVNEGFCQRIRSNYNLMTADLDGEELLHMVTSPPEVYLAQASSSQIMNQTMIFDQKEVKIEMMNNLLNRLSMNQEVHLTYQDKIYIDNVLRKLGIKNTAQFIQEINRQKIWNQSQEEKIKHCWSLLEEYHKGEDIRQETTAIVNNRLEELQQEQNQYLHEVIMNRLQTGIIYRIMENFNGTNLYHNQWMEQQQILLTEQKKISHQILLNQLENYLTKETIPFVYLEKNHYEIMEEEALQEPSKEGIQQQITKAVLFQLLNNIHMERITRKKKEEQVWIRFQNSLYQSAENTIFRMKNQVQIMGTKEDKHKEVRTEEKKDKIFYEQSQLVFSERGRRDEIEQQKDLGDSFDYFYEGPQTKQSYYQENQTEVKNNQFLEGDYSLHEEFLYFLHNQDNLSEDKEQENLLLQGEKNSRELVQPTSRENIIQETIGETYITKKDSNWEQYTKEVNKEFNQKIERINEEIKNWENYKGITEEKDLVSEFTASKVEEYQLEKQNDLYTTEAVNLEYVRERIENFTTEKEKEKNDNDFLAERIQYNEPSDQLYERLQEINKKNIENLENYKRFLEEGKEITKITSRTIEEKRTESLKALQNPREFMWEYKKEGERQLQQQEETKRQLLEYLPPETKEIYQVIDAYQEGKPTDSSLGVIKNDLGGLTRDTQLVLKQQEKFIEEKETVLEKETRETNKILERWRKEEEPEVKKKQVYQKQREISLVHKQVQQNIEEEVLQKLWEENKALIEKQINNEVIHQEQVKITTVENKQEHQIIQKNSREITELINQGVKRQIGAISDQVYHRLEKKLSNEKKRRGF